MRFFQWLNDTYIKNQHPDIQIPSDSSAPLVRRRFLFSGTVQGVGFRYEAKLIASQLDLVGWVRNQVDGSVAVEIEGAANYIEAFLLALQAVPRFDITNIQAEDLSPSKTESSFRVLY